MIGAQKYAAPDPASGSKTRDYRARIYAQYSSGRHERLAPASIEALSQSGPYLSRLVSRHFPPDRKAIVLDLGCGHGSLVHFARHSGYLNVRGVDSSVEQVEAASRLGIQNVELGDAIETLSAVPDSSCDVVVTFDVIEHFARDEVLSLVDGVHRALRDGGRWIIHTVNAESPFFGRIRYGDVTHETAYTRTSLGQLLLSSGFRRVDCYEDSPVVHGVMSAMRFVLWQLIRGAMRLSIASETGNSGRESIFSQNFLAVAVK
ncbi:MAG: cyclopropane-fatty-acyl-phospholipid synthase family protein [Gemmatimonadaceae bacterium]